MLRDNGDGPADLLTSDQVVELRLIRPRMQTIVPAA